MEPEVHNHVHNSPHGRSENKKKSIVSQHLAYLA